MPGAVWRCWWQRPPAAAVVPAGLSLPSRIHLCPAAPESGPTCLPACLPASLSACWPACPPACLAACLPSRLPAHPPAGLPAVEGVDTGVSRGREYYYVDQVGIGGTAGTDGTTHARRRAAAPACKPRRRACGCQPAIPRMLLVHAAAAAHHEMCRRLSPAPAPGGARPRGGAGARGGQCLPGEQPGGAPAQLSWRPYEHMCAWLRCAPLCQGLPDRLRLVLAGWALPTLLPHCTACSTESTWYRLKPTRGGTLPSRLREG